jgi:hypothetical protein
MSEKYLANENFPAETVRLLREKGDDVVHAAETLIGASDEVILQAAVEQDRIVLTFDTGISASWFFIGVDRRLLGLCSFAWDRSLLIRCYLSSESSLRLNLSCEASLP